MLKSSSSVELLQLSPSLKEKHSKCWCERRETRKGHEFSTAFDGISLNSASLEGVTLWCKEAAAGPSHCCSMSFW